MDDGAVRALETLSAEISRIFAERQELRARDATRDELEANRVLLVQAQGRLSQLLIERYGARPHAA